MTHVAFQPRDSLVTGIANDGSNWIPNVMWRQARPALWWIWPIAVIVVLALQLWFPDAGTGVLHDTYSPTAEGQKAFFRLVEEHAEWTVRNTQPLSITLRQGNVEPTLCILGPKRWPTSSEWDAILDWVEEGGQLLFSFRGFEEQTVPRLNIRYVPRTGVTPPDDSLPPETELLRSSNIAWWTDGHIVAPDAASVVEYDDTTQAVIGTLGYGRFVVCASNLVFSNQLLTYGDNPVLAMRLLEQASDLDGVTFDESLNATGTPKAAGLLFDRELRPLTLQLILITVLYGWWNFQRFGPFLKSAVGGRHNIVDHTDTLGTAYWHSRNGSSVLQAYWKLTSQELGLPAAAAAPPVAIDQLAQRLGESSDTVREFLEHVRLSTANRQVVPRRAAAAMIRQLARWRELAQLRKGRTLHPQPTARKA